MLLLFVSPANARQDEILSLLPDFRKFDSSILLPGTKSPRKQSTPRKIPVPPTQNEFRHFRFKGLPPRPDRGLSAQTSNTLAEILASPPSPINISNDQRSLITNPSEGNKSARSVGRGLTSLSDRESHRKPLSTSGNVSRQTSNTRAEAFTSFQFLNSDATEQAFLVTNASKRNTSALSSGKSTETVQDVATRNDEEPLPWGIRSNQVARSNPGEPAASASRGGWILGTHDLDSDDEGEEMSGRHPYDARRASTKVAKSAQ